MSTLDGPIWSRHSIALICPARSHFQRTQSKGGQGWDERYHPSREEDNEEMKKGKRGAGEKKKKKRKQATDFEEAVCCPSAVIQGAA